MIGLCGLPNFYTALTKSCTYDVSSFLHYCRRPIWYWHSILSSYILRNCTIFIFHFSRCEFVQRSRSVVNLVESIIKIKRFLHERYQILKQQQMVEQVVDTKPLKDHVIPNDKEPHCSIIHLPITVNNFKIKPSLVGMVQHNQFSGLPVENTNLHLSIFVEFYGTLKANDVDQNAIRLRLFTFSLRDIVRAWLQSLPANSITTWTQLKIAFLERHFLPS